MEAAGAIVLLAATIAALVWANSAWGESYFEFWDIHITFEVSGFHFDESLVRGQSMDQLLSELRAAGEMGTDALEVDNSIDGETSESVDDGEP